MEVLILDPDLDFWNSDPKKHFWANLGLKSQSCSFCFKIGTYGISKMLIFIPILVFWIWNPNFPFGQIWAKKKSKLSVLTKNWHTWNLGSEDSESGLAILTPKFIFGQIWVKNIKVVCFSSKLARMVSWRCWFLFWN